MAQFTEEEGLAELEDQMARDLEDPRALRNDRVKAKREQALADEWARIDHLKAQQAEEQEAAKKQVHTAQQDMLRAGLTAQKAEASARKAAEVAESRAWAVELQRQAAAYRAEQTAKRTKSAAAFADLKAKREQQLVEQRQAKDAAAKQRHQDEADAAATAAAHIQAQMKEEDSVAVKAQADLKEFLAANEEHRALREARKLEERASDRAFMAEYAKAMEAQEAKREAALAVARARQDVQAAAAQARPESKRWIDPELIERYAREKDAADLEEEQRRKAHVEGQKAALQAALGVQLAERAGRRGQHASDQKAELAVINGTVQAGHELDRQDREKYRHKQAVFKQMLDDQVQTKAAINAMASTSMSSHEKAINADLLRRAAAPASH